MTKNEFAKMLQNDFDYNINRAMEKKEKIKETARTHDYWYSKDDENKTPHILIEGEFYGSNELPGSVTKTFTMSVKELAEKYGIAITEEVGITPERVGENQPVKSLTSRPYEVFSANIVMDGESETLAAEPTEMRPTQDLPMATNEAPGLPADTFVYEDTYDKPKKKSPFVDMLNEAYDYYSTILRHLKELEEENEVLRSHIKELDYKLNNKKK